MLTVKDIMTTDMLFVYADWSLERLSQFYLDNHISGAPVFDTEENLVGVVSLSDLVYNNALVVDQFSQTRPHDYYMQGLFEGKLNQEDVAHFKVMSVSDVHVSDIMTKIVFEVDENTSLQRAADVMFRGHIHRVFITRDRKVVGIVTTMDMLKVIRELPVDFSAASGF